MVDSPVLVDDRLSIDLQKEMEETNKKADDLVLNDMRKYRNAIKNEFKGNAKPTFKGFMALLFSENVELKDPKRFTGENNKWENLWNESSKPKSNRYYLGKVFKRGGKKTFRKYKKSKTNLTRRRKTKK